MKIIKKYFILFLLIQIFNQHAISKQPVILNETFNPRYLKVTENQLYVAEKYSVQIYDRKEFKHIKTFGRKGEGPGEIRLVYGLSVGNHYVAVSDPGKIHVFSSNGELIKSLKSTSIVLRFAPIGNDFVGWGTRGMGKDGFMIVGLFDEHLKKIKEIYQYKGESPSTGKFNILSPDVNFYVSDDRIFINGKDDRIHCFDRNGKEIRSLPLDIELLEVTQEFKTDYINAMKSNKKSAMLYTMYKSVIEFPKYFPKVRYFRVSNKRIYIITYRQEGPNHQCIVMDYSGNITKKVFIPIQLKDIRDAYPFDIRNGIFYQAVEDEDDGPAKLWITEIK